MRTTSGIFYSLKSFPLNIPALHDSIPMSLQHPVPLVRGDRRFVIADHVAQHGFGIAAEHWKLPAPCQLRVGEVKRKIRQDDPPEAGIIHRDHEAALF